MTERGCETDAAVDAAYLAQDPLGPDWKPHPEGWPGAARAWLRLGHHTVDPEQGIDTRTGQFGGPNAVRG